MSALFTSSWRKKAAIVALVFYTLGIAAPAAAAVLAGAGAHCLTGSRTHEASDSHHTQSSHSHADHDAAQPDQPEADDHGPMGKCCGSFCLTALAPADMPIAEPALHVSRLIQPLAPDLFGQASDPIDRPPRNLAPL